MKRLYAAIALSLVHGRCCLAQTTTTTQDSVLEEARFPVSRGSNFTFQPSSGSLCYWAVAQYDERRHEFFNLESQPVCPPSVANVSTTLLVRFGGRSRPGNVTLTVQCGEPSVWNFLVKDDGASYDGETTVQPICSEDESHTDGEDPDIPPPHGTGTHGGHAQASDALPAGSLTSTSPAYSQGNLSFGIPPSLSTLMTSFGSVPRGSDWASQMHPSNTAGLYGTSLSTTWPYDAISPGSGVPGAPTGSTAGRPTQDASVTSSPESDATVQGPDRAGSSHGLSVGGDRSMVPTSAGGAAGTSAPSSPGGDPTSSSTNSASPDDSASSQNPSSSSLPVPSDDPSSSGTSASPDDSTSPDDSPLTEDPTSSDSTSSPDDPTGSDNPASPDNPTAPGNPTSPNDPVSSNGPSASNTSDPSSSSGTGQNNPDAASASAPCTCVC